MRLDWYPMLAVQIERTVRASELIRRSSPDAALADAAEKWSDAAITYMDPQASGSPSMRLATRWSGPGKRSRRWLTRGADVGVVSSRSVVDLAVLHGHAERHAGEVAARADAALPPRPSVSEPAN